ncbi:MAG: 50S ribosomal protein L13 [Bacillota bacterium]
MKTYMAKPNEVERKWYIVDAAGKPIGRVATEVATLLRGKHKPTYTPNVDCGDYVIVINSKDAILTGNKLDQKELIRHSRYPGGLKRTSYRELMAKKPDLALEVAIKGMLPHTKLGRQMYKKLKVYRGADHPHEAQKPEVWGREA